MRVELIHTPGCHTYKKTLDLLQTVIAEERLPVHVEVTEEVSKAIAKPRIRIDGNEVAENAQLEEDNCMPTTKLSSGLPCMEKLRELLCRRWKDITELPAFGR